MYVIGVKRSITLTQEEIAQSECCDEIIPTHELSNRIQTCDVVVITAPFNETTKNVFDKNMISNMKQNVIFINVGRGGIVDEMTLAEALNTNQIAGCYCDVFAVEPLPSSHPLWQCENIIISPHDSASCVDNAFRVQDGFVDNLIICIDTVQGKRYKMFNGVLVLVAVVVNCETFVHTVSL